MGFRFINLNCFREKTPRYEMKYVFRSLTGDILFCLDKVVLTNTFTINWNFNTLKLYYTRNRLPFINGKFRPTCYQKNELQ